MAYTGYVPSSLYIWRPSQVTITDDWRVLVSEFETGAEQRRLKWSTPRLTVAMQYEIGTLVSNEANDVWRFWKAMNGPFKSFDLPLFGRLTTVESTFAAGDPQMGVADTQDLTGAPGSRYNMIYVQNDAGEYDTFVVASVIDATTINVQSARVNSVSFVAGEPVSGVINARFSATNMSFDYLVALMSTVGVEFTEVRS